MSPRLRTSLALAGLALVVAAAGAWLLGQRSGPTPRLVVETAGGKVLLGRPITPGDRFTLSYRHSVSQTRVAGVFEVARDGGLIVKETSFGTFGPGLPALQPGDRYEIQGGMIRQVDLDQRLPALSLFVHPYTEHRLEVGREILDLSGVLPAGTRVVISVVTP